MRFPWQTVEKTKPDTQELQSNIEGVLVARIQREYREVARSIYGDDWILTNGSFTLAVGPMQTFLGFAIKNGYIKVNHD